MDDDQYYQEHQYCQRCRKRKEMIMVFISIVLVVLIGTTGRLIEKYLDVRKIEAQINIEQNNQ